MTSFRAIAMRNSGQKSRAQKPVCLGHKPKKLCPQRESSKETNGLSFWVLCPGCARGTDISIKGVKKGPCARLCARGTNSGTSGHKPKKLCPQRESVNENNGLRFWVLCPGCARKPKTSRRGTNSLSLKRESCARLDGRGRFRSVHTAGPA
jgi:hypothetical protein